MSFTRCAILGTAPSWRKTPWDDPGLRIVSLNDAYSLGFARIDEWYEIHPLHNLISIGPDRKAIYPHEIPPGHYLRPQTHLQWLAPQAQTIPIWRADAPPADWPNAQRFPKEAIEAHFGRYFGSGPAWMLAHKIMQGYQEIHIYGIHLATEHEYREQRPNFEFLIGRVLGDGAVTETKANGCRRYETAHGAIVLPDERPLIQASYLYAFQPRPSSYHAPYQWELHKLGVKRERLGKALHTRPRRETGAPLQRELWRVEAQRIDWQQQLDRVQFQQQYGV